LASGKDLHTKILLDLPAIQAPTLLNSKYSSIGDKSFGFQPQAEAEKKKHQKRKKKQENFTNLRILKKLRHTTRKEATYCEFRYPSGIILAVSSRYSSSTSIWRSHDFQASISAWQSFSGVRRMLSWAL
jgi:hypothetical protein